MVCTMQISGGFCPTLLIFSVSHGCTHVLIMQRSNGELYYCSSMEIGEYTSGTLNLHLVLSSQVQLKQAEI